jgi:hypothetical protein
MFSIELCRAIDADRKREVERAMLRRRLLEALAIRPTLPAGGQSMPGGRDARPGTSGSPALGPAR